jgi:methylenetetrahydrofolate dehydrogenase (NADP+)/methenyltetrahydrofolate cyclohydrolase
MPAQIIDGKAIAEKTLQQIKNSIDKTNPPGLAVVLVGHDPASEIYVRNKVLACQKVGIRSVEHYLNPNISQQDLEKLIDQLNRDSSIHGILVQLPLPAHIDSHTIVEKIDWRKDVDGFHPYNLGRLAQQRPYLRPCTPAGIMTLLNQLESPAKNLTGLNATVIGVSNIVGRPMALELLMAKCTVTACHSHTQNLEKFVQQADILVAAAGKPGLVKGEWIKPNAIVIDVGMNRLTSGQLIGDVEFEQAKKHAAWITPVPGGVGPMTVATLLKNTLEAYEKISLTMEESS